MPSVTTARATGPDGSLHPAPLRLAVVGAHGRMGQAVRAHIEARWELVLHAALDREDDLAAGLEGAQAVIDFSAPAVTATLAHLCAQRGLALVSGTTGLEPEQQAAVLEASRRIPLVQAGNFSVGVTTMLALVEQAARLLGPQYDTEVLEMHHRRKVDAPSGTALDLGAAAAQGRGLALEDHAVFSRAGHTGARAPDAIGFAALRGGGVIGDHTVIFAGEQDRIELTHRAASRDIYAEGAVRAALWAIHRAPGLYGMRAVLGL